jgi:hypothetical protein
MLRQLQASPERSASRTAALEKGLRDDNNVARAEIGVGAYISVLEQVAQPHVHVHFFPINMTHDFGPVTSSIWR